jgi:hypothetical protein
LPKDVDGYEGISVKEAFIEDIEKRLGGYAMLNAE